MKRFFATLLLVCVLLSTSFATDATWSFGVVNGVNIGTAVSTTDASVRATALQVNGVYIIFATGGPTGFPAPIGSLFLNSGGTAGTSVYFKESGADSSGWVARNVGNLTGNLTGNVTGNVTGTASGVQAALQSITGDGAITNFTGLVVLSKGSAAAITIAAPTAGTDDGKVVIVLTTTAQAHVITSAVDGFNAKGSSGTVTFTAAIGNSVSLLAYNGHWYCIVKNGVTVA